MSITILKVNNTNSVAMAEVKQMVRDLSERCEAGAYDSIVIGARYAGEPSTDFWASSALSLDEQIGMLERIKARLLRKDLEREDQ